MLSAYGAAVVAFIGDGYIICADCAQEQITEKYGEMAFAKAEMGLQDYDGLSALIRYTVESEFAQDGLYCENCHHEIVEPEPFEDEDEDDG